MQKPQPPDTFGKVAIMSARRYWQHFVEFGTHDYPPETRRRLQVLNVVCYLIALFTLVYAVQHALIDRPGWWPVILVNLLLVVVALSIPFMHRINDIAGAIAIAVAELLAMFFIIAHLGRAGGVQIQYIALAAAPFVILGLGRLKIVLCLVAAAFALHIASWFLFPPGAALIKVNSADLNSLYFVAALTTFVIISSTVFYAFRLAEQAEAETDSLLRNILPDNVVERLKANPGAPIADKVECASVLFSDLKGFVEISHDLGPQRTVALLNELMKMYDELASRHGIEKIKTIGDAYMAASGVPETVPDHAARVAAMALDMMHELQHLSERNNVVLAQRIGIATGPMMAGVIGAKRLTYDIWGDTVNLAARLEALSNPGEILIDEETMTRLSDTYVFDPRGAVEVKGMGPIEAWILTCAKPST